MINKDLFKNIKGRRIYLFWLDEETGEITDVTSRSDVRHVVFCKDCKYAYKGIKSYTCQRVFKPFTIEEDGFCSWAERKEE